MKKRILYLSNYMTFSVLIEHISRITNEAGCELMVTSTVAPNFPIEDLAKTIEAADLVIADISSAENDFAIGQVFARSVPILFIAAGIGIYNQRYQNFLISIYREDHMSTFAEQFRQIFEKTLPLLNQRQHREGDSAIRRTKKQSVFISYSHQDAEYLARLLIHLRPLERSGALDIWVDTRLRSGDSWKLEIEKALNAAEVAILLVSADFLASDFIVNHELPPLLDRAQQNGTRIVPIILKSCRFTRDKELRVFQAINDPEKPVCEMDENTREKTFDRVAREIEERLGV